jgi:hypothetical protein
MSLRSRISNGSLKPHLHQSNLILMVAMTMREKFTFRFTLA